MLWSGANPRGHRWSTRARSPPATASSLRVWSLSTASLFLNIPFSTAVALSSRGLLLLRSEPSAVVVALSIVYECTLHDGWTRVRWQKFVSHQREHPRHCQVNGHMFTSREFAPHQHAQRRRRGEYGQYAAEAMATHVRKRSSIAV